MPSKSFQLWIDLKKQTPVFEKAVSFKRRKQSESESTLDSMSAFFREADKIMK